MTTLAANVPQTYSLGDSTQYPVVATDIIYNGAAVGENGAGYARPLTAGDRFLGFALEKADNATGAAGAIYVTVAKRGSIQLAVTGLAVTDLGHPVYASDDAAFSLSPVGGTFVGFVSRVVSSAVGIVDFDAVGFRDPWGGYTWEAVDDNKTLDEQDNAKGFWVTTDAKTITLPAVLALHCVIANGAVDGAVLVTVAPNSADGIAYKDAASTDNKAILNTKATARRGDFIVLEYGDADGWQVTRARGTWAKS
jgi:hypothetical protein